MVWPIHYLQQENHETLHVFPSHSLAVPIEARSPLFLVQKSSFRSSVGMRPFLASRLTYEDITKYRNDDLAATAAVSQSGARSVDASWHKKVGYKIGSEEDL